MVLYRSEVQQQLRLVEQAMEEMVAKLVRETVTETWQQLEGEEQEEAKGVVARTAVK